MCQHYRMSGATLDRPTDRDSTAHQTIRENQQRRLTHPACSIADLVFVLASAIDAAPLPTTLQSGRRGTTKADAAPISRAAVVAQRAKALLLIWEGILSSLRFLLCIFFYYVTAVK